MSDLASEGGRGRGNSAAVPRVRPWVAAEQKEIDESRATINNLAKKAEKEADVSNVNLLTRLASVKNMADMMVPERPRPIVREPTKWIINPMISVTTSDEAVEEAISEHEDFAMSVQLARAERSHSDSSGGRPSSNSFSSNSSNGSNSGNSSSSSSNSGGGGGGCARMASGGGNHHHGGGERRAHADARSNHSAHFGAAHNTAANTTAATTSSSSSTSASSTTSSASSASSTSPTASASRLRMPSRAAPVSPTTTTTTTATANTTTSHASQASHANAGAHKTTPPSDNTAKTTPNTSPSPSPNAQTRRVSTTTTATPGGKGPSPSPSPTAQARRISATTAPTTTTATSASAASSSSSSSTANYTSAMQSSSARANRLSTSAPSKAPPPVTKTTTTTTATTATTASTASTTAAVASTTTAATTTTTATVTPSTTTVTPSTTTTHATTATHATATTHAAATTTPLTTATTATTPVTATATTTTTTHHHSNEDVTTFTELAPPSPTAADARRLSAAPSRAPPHPPARKSEPPQPRASTSMTAFHVLGPVGSVSVPATGPLSAMDAYRALDQACASTPPRYNKTAEHKFREVTHRLTTDLDNASENKRGSIPRVAQLARQDAIVGQQLILGKHTPPIFPTWISQYDMEPNAAAFSSDGTLLAVGWGDAKGAGRGHEGHIKLYEAETGRPHRIQLPKKTTAVNAIAFSPDGALMAVCAGRTVSIHSLPSFDMPREIDAGADGEFLCCCFSADGLFLAAGGTTRQLMVWSTALSNSALSHMVLYNFSYPNPIASCRFSQDGLHIVAGLDGTGKVTRRRISTGKIESTFDHHGVLCCAFSPNFSMLAEGGRKHTLILRDAGTGDVIQAFAHSVDILCCDFSPDGALIAAGDASGSLIVRRIASGVIEHSFTCATEVRTCVFSPDGKRLAATGPEGAQACVYWIPPARTARAFSHKLSFENIGQLHHSAGYVPSGVGAHGQLRTTRDLMAGCDFSPDSTLVATRVKWGRHIVFYDSVRGNPIRHLSNSQVFTCLKFSPSGDSLACGDCVGSLILFDVQTGERLSSFKHSVGIASLCFSQDGTFLAASDRDGTIQIRHLQTGSLEATMTGFCQSPPDIFARHSISFSPDTSLFACAMGKELFVWRVFTLVSWGLEHKFTHPKHDCPHLSGLSFSPDGQYLSVGAGKEVIVRNTTTWETTAVLSCADDRHIVTHICYSPEGDFLAVAMRCLKVILDGSPRNQVVVYRTSNFSLDQEFERSHEISYCTFSSDGKYLAAAGGDEGNLTVWRFFGPPVTKGVHSKSYFACCVMSNDGQRVAIGGRECRVVVFNADTNDVLCIFEHPAPVACVAFSPNGRKLASGGHDSNLVLWDDDGNVLMSWARQGSVLCCAFSADGLYLAAGGADHKLNVMLVSSGSMVYSFEHTGAINSCCFSADNLRLACGGDDGRLTIRRVETGETEKVFVHTAPVTAVCFSPDASLIVAGDSASKVIVRRVELSVHLALLLSFTHSASVTNVYFSPDGEYLITCGEDGNLSTRPIQTGEVALNFRGTHCCMRAPCPITKTQLLITFDGDLQTSRLLTPHLMDPSWLLHCSAGSLLWLLEMGRLDPAAHDANGATLIGKLFTEQPALAIVIARRAPPALLLTTLEAAVKTTGNEGETVNELLKAWGQMPISEGLPYGADGAVGVLARLVVAAPETAARLLQKVFAPTQDAAGRGELHRYIEEIQTKSSRNLQMNVWSRGVNNPNDPAVHSLVSRVPGLLDPPPKWPVIRHVQGNGQQPRSIAGALNLGSVFHSTTRLSDQPGKRALFETVFMKQAVLHKWKRIRFFFFAMMLCYTTYLIFLYVSAAQIRLFAEGGAAPDPWPFQATSILLSAIGMIGQLLEMRNNWSGWNVASLISFCLNAGVNIYYLLFGTDKATFDAVSALHAVALLSASVGMFSFLKVMPGTGPKVVMVISIMKDIRWFVLLVMVVMIAFGSSFVLIFPWDDAGSNPAEQALLMYRMTLGDFDPERYDFNPVVRLFFLGFTFVVVIVFLNLLIAIMGDTYDRIKETEEVENYKALARYICDVEVNWGFLLHRRLCCGVRGNEYFYVLSPIADLESLGSSWEGRMQTIRRYVEEAVNKLGKDVRERQSRMDVKLDQANRRLVLMAGSDPLKKIQ